MRCILNNITQRELIDRSDKLKNNFDYGPIQKDTV